MASFGRGSRLRDERPPPRPSFTPQTRDVDEIFKDDEGREDLNAEVYKQDSKVEVVGGPEDLSIVEKWEDAGLSEAILANVKRARYLQPRNFQMYAIPLLMTGHDLKGQAETGSGKSAAFLLPIIQSLVDSFKELGDTSRRMKVYALIIEPTRELAKQLWEQGCKFANGTGVTVNFAYGEYNLNINKNSLFSKGCDILIGTPGRLKHLITDNIVDCEPLQFLVLDEADRLLDFNFMPEIEAITRVKDFPTVENRQTLFFSATFNEDISRIANSICRPGAVWIKNTNQNVNARIRQKLIRVPYNKRKQYLVDMLKKEMDENNGVLKKKLVFVETKRDADFIATLLCDNGIKAQTVNGDRPQSLREEATQGFRSGLFTVLVVTNVFARGMDFSDLGEVINFQLPTDRETYIHRIGRTGRLNQGKAISFYDPDHPADRDMVQILNAELENEGDVE